MKKLNILKTIIDLVWIMSIITLPICMLFIGFALTDSSKDGIPIRIQGVLYDEHNFSTKLLLLSSFLSYIIIICSVFLFRKVLREFQNTKVFSLSVIKNLNTIGIVLITGAFLNGLSSFLYPIFVKSKLELSFNLNPFILMLCFGLFFMILSEVFRIAKKAKEDNELTV
jgi:hypothetical protein